jgi:iron complex transport system permease protein
MKRSLIIFAELVILSVALAMSLNVGRIDIPLHEIILAVFSGGYGQHGETARHVYVIREIRIPRTLMAAMAGINLSLAGLVMQNVLRNPLADPYTLGIASGAAFGAALYIVLGKSVLSDGIRIHQSLLLSSNAFLFSMVSLSVTLLISSRGKGPTTVLLGGIATGGIFSACLSVMKYFSDNEALKNLEIWLLGGFWGANSSNVKVLAVVTVLSTTLIYRFSWQLNAMSAGEDIAVSVGVNVRFVNYFTVIVATLVASVTIAFSGVIGFIGLVCPFLARGLVGFDNRYLIPASALTGGILLTIADLAARTVIQPQEMPVGVITTVLGSPFFIYMLARKNVW